MSGSTHSPTPAASPAGRLSAAKPPEASISRAPTNPATTSLMESATPAVSRASGRNWVELGPEARLDSVAQEWIELDLLGVVAGALEQLGVLRDARHPELRQPVLARAQHVAG